MTDTLISLISIFIGIIGANFAGYIFKKKSLGTIGNTIAGVFGSIFFLKAFGRLGFDPKTIMSHGNVNILLFTINSIVSFIGGGLFVILIDKIKTKLKI